MSRFVLLVGLVACAKSGGSADGGRTAEMAYLEGQQKLMSGDFVGAAQAYGDAVLLDPQRVQSHHALGEALFLQGKFTEAADSFARAVAMDRTKRASWLRLAKSLSRAGRSAEALDAYARTRALDEKDPEAWKEGAETEASVGRYDDAVASLERAASLAPGDAAVVLGRAAEIRLAARDTRAALALLDRATRAGLKDAPLWAKLGDEFVRNGDMAGASEAFRQASEANPDEPLYPETLGDAFTRLGRWSDAEKAFSRSLGIVERASPHLGLARMYKARGDRALAKKELRLALDLATGEESAETRDLAATSAMLGAHDDAVRLYEILVREPEMNRDASLWLALARSQKALGRTADQKASCLHLKELEPKAPCP